MITKNYSWSLGSCPNKSLDSLEPPVRPRQADHQLWSAAACVRSTRAFTRTGVTPLSINAYSRSDAFLTPQAFHARLLDLYLPYFPQRHDAPFDTHQHKVSTNQHLNFNAIFICKPLTINEKSI
jgi:hypothetical protein